MQAVARPRWERIHPKFRIIERHAQPPSSYPVVKPSCQGRTFSRPFENSPSNGCGAIQSEG
jgi:hypothetical protein